MTIFKENSAHELEIGYYLIRYWLYDQHWYAIFFIEKIPLHLYKHECNSVNVILLTCFRIKLRGGGHKYRTVWEIHWGRSCVSHCTLRPNCQYKCSRVRYIYQNLIKIRISGKSLSIPIFNVLTIFHFRSDLFKYSCIYIPKVIFTLLKYWQFRCFDINSALFNRVLWFVFSVRLSLLLPIRPKVAVMFIRRQSWDRKI